MQLSDLADELIWHVCSKVPPQAILDRVVCTCSSWNAIVKEETFWREYATHYSGVIRSETFPHSLELASNTAVVPTLSGSLPDAVAPPHASGESCPSSRALLRHFPRHQAPGGCSSTALTVHQIQQLLLYLQPSMHPGSPADPRRAINCLPPRNLCRYYHQDLNGAAGRLCNASTTDHPDNEDVSNTLPLGVGIRHRYTCEAIATCADDDRLEDILECVEWL
jgi:hypothetical protein